MSFKPHMTFAEAHQLKIGGKIDHRNSGGKFVMATITHQSHSGVFKLHYDGMDVRNDTQCSYINALHLFAVAGSISRRPAHRLRYIKHGSFVDINVPQHPGWRKAECVGLCSRSGQIQVQYLLDISEGKSSPLKWTTWVHLDNSKEVSRFGHHTYTKEINHVAISLETNRALMRTPMPLRSVAAQRCVDEIYGGMSNLLETFLIKHSTPTQLQQIQQILKNLQIEYDDGLDALECESETECCVAENVSVAETASESHSIVVGGDDGASVISHSTMDGVSEVEVEGDEVENEAQSLYDLPMNAVSYICGFLNRKDIKAFKTTSYRHGIACLDEMTKCNVGISNVNDIINDMDNQFTDALGMSTRKNYKFHRYPANTDYITLRSEWKEKYGIPLSQQLLLSEGIKCRFYDTRKNEQMSDFKIRAIPTSNFLLFDKRHTIKFDERTSKPRVMDVCNEKQQHLIFIKWFDMHEQRIIPLQFVMGNHDQMTIANITEYLQHEFIGTTDKQKAWHSNLLACFEKMNEVDVNYPKLICFKEHRNKLTFGSDINEVINWWGIVVFQLNATHPYFADKTFTSVLEKYKTLISV
mmetsp:Transcript_43677/g.72135  ORF Transcript_43677/g.72135 Transcript_43677/m.72135 type:complete len:584 (+) Transcript_43677:45-1796(+)|eukprot:CAMPEP_0202690694 /NCGR_PEP_ID=MMETSP1385-20130828/5610_1 /ASSEMBLY_ACC=CAM_ASM_000861 /TAXON_ID=933848 /ORGANISM="Elphidium margaritaceum" /LENGTH=583 /DNA_ID=CAMNT_0049345979 /DNA_START=24 /DNA_END=1775 /DNA_ORIENTATION=+